MNQLADRRAVTLVLAAFLCALGPPRSTFACTMPPGGLQHYTIADRARAAPIVLEGTVTKIGQLAPYVATVAVQRYLKGGGPATVTIGNFGPMSMCRSDVQVGDHGIFFASGDPSSGLFAFYLSQGDAVAPVDPHVVAEVSEAAGQAPAVPEGTPRGDAGALIVVGALVGLGAAAGLVRVKWRLGHAGADSRRGRFGRP